MLFRSKNAITYKETFKLIKENKLWIGVMPMGRDMLFDVPDRHAEKMASEGKANSSYKIVDGVIKGRSPSIWFTNMDNKKRHEEITLFRRYKENPALYPKYDNYDAIEVSKVADIPEDYDGVMGVPITFLDKYNPKQFEILGMDDHRIALPNWRGRGPDLNGNPIYRRIIIQRKKS